MTITLPCLQLKKDISLYFEKVVPKTLLDDMDVKACALAGGSHYMNTYRNERNKLCRVTRNRIGSKLDTYGLFANTFLPGMSPVASPQCSLAMLSQDEETTESLKRLLAEYLDVPTTGKERMASAGFEPILGLAGGRRLFRTSLFVFGWGRRLASRKHGTTTTILNCYCLSNQASF